MIRSSDVLPNRVNYHIDVEQALIEIAQSIRAERPGAKLAFEGFELQPLPGRPAAYEELGALQDFYLTDRTIYLNHVGHILHHALNSTFYRARVDFAGVQDNWLVFPNQTGEFSLASLDNPNWPPEEIEPEILALWGGGGDDPDGDGGEVDFVTFPTLQPGVGWAGPTPQPAAVGSPDDPGYDAKAIARWDVVPFQTFEEGFTVGVVAFHMNGIDRVEFSVDDGPWVPVYEMQLNPRTDVMEYAVTLEPALFEDGPVEVRAIAWPMHAGEPRVLAGPIFEPGPYVSYRPTEGFKDGNHSMVLHANANGTLEGPTAYVRPYNGVREGDGTLSNPFTYVIDAITVISSNPDNKFGRVELILPGEYEFGPQPNASAIHADFADSYIVVAPSDGIDASEVVIKNSQGIIDPRQARIKYERVAFDTAVDRLSGHMPWFDEVLFFDSLGWENEDQLMPVSGLYFATDSTALDKLYAFPGAAMLRSCHAERISGDVWQTSKMVLKCTADNVDGTVLVHHTDLYQMWSGLENAIVYDSVATNLVQVQSLFLQPSSGVLGHLTNSAFVNLQIANERVANGSIPNWGGTPWSQMQGTFSHVVFDGVSLPNQRFMFRTDMSGDARFQGHNVTLRDSVLHWATYDALVTNGVVPDGVTIDQLQRGPE